MTHFSNDIVLPIALYAEIHYRFFKGFPSLLFKKEPEIIFDCPRRIAPGNELPIMLLINDLDNIKIKTHEVTISVSSHSQPIQIFNFSDVSKYEIQHPLKSNQNVYLFFLKIKTSSSEKVYINCKAIITINNRKIEIFNDNLQTSSKSPYSCYISSEKLPGSQYCLYGDMHFHSQYSQSHVEFGPPLAITEKIAKASGLDFISITDHSYDLACKIDNYLVEDKALTRWKSFKEQISALNSDIVFLPGEEISCNNQKGQTVHLCAIGISNYIPGSNDGARRNKVHRTQHSLNEAVRLIHSDNGLAYAAHPGAQKSFLQSVFLNRGSWSDNDITSSNLDGVQAFNGSYKEAWLRGKMLWINALKKGLKLPLIAGNDAHGDFNRYRAIKAPFISIYENFNRYMGFGKTGVYCTEKSFPAIMKSIKNHKTFITTGPFISISYDTDPNNCLVSTVPLSPEIRAVYIHCISSPEFGRITNTSLFGYVEGENEERLLFSMSYKSECYKVQELFSLPSLDKYCYIRAETQSRQGDTIFEALTSPCYFK